MLTTSEFAARCAADGEFRLAARHWDGGLRLIIGDEPLAMTLIGGEPKAGDPGDGPAVITLAGPAELWEQMLLATPPRFTNDVSPARALGLEVRTDGLLWWQYTPAVQRAVELLRAGEQT